MSMNSMIITNNTLSIERMKTIGIRTGSELMAGAKAMMIENLKKQMRNGLAHFIYLKKDGSIREAFGTTNKALVTKYINGNGVSREHYATTAYFDVEVGAWRSFRWENLIAVE